MTLGDVRAQLVGLCNRKDLTSNTSLQTLFLQQGMGRIQRQLRVPSMERTSYFTATEVVQSYLVPIDLIEIMDVFVNGEPLDHLSFREMCRMGGPNMGAIVGCPKYYARVGASLFVFPAMQSGDVSVMTYYGTFSNMTDDTQSNEVTASTPDLLTYAALSYAGDYFMMDNKAGWEAAFQTIMQETQDQANQLDMKGGSTVVRSAYGDC